MYAGLYDQAAAAYLSLAAAGPGNPEFAAMRIHALLRGNKPKVAYAEADSLRSRFPKSAAVTAALGAVHFRKADFPAAESSFRAAVELDRDCGEAWLGLAALAGAVSKRGRQKEYADLAFRTLPGDPHAMRAWAPFAGDASARAALMDKAFALLDPKAEDYAHWKLSVEASKAIGDRRIGWLDSAYQPYSLKLIALMNGPRNRSGWGVEARFNHGPKLRLLLDTGASGILLKRNALGRLKLERLGSTSAELKGVGDEKGAGFVAALAGLVEFGEVKIRDLPVTVLTESARVEIADGLVGSDVFSDFLVTLDIPQARLLLAPLPGRDAPPAPREVWDRVVPEAEKDFTPAYRAGNHLFIPVEANGLASGYFLIDTGAFATVIDATFAKRTTRVRADPQARVTGVKGEVAAVKRSDTVNLVFCGMQQSNDDAITIDLEAQGNAFGFEVSGILGRTVLDLLSITVDYRNGLVKLVPGRR